MFISSKISRSWKTKSDQSIFSSYKETKLSITIKCNTIFYIKEINGLIVKLWILSVGWIIILYHCYCINLMSSGYIKECILQLKICREKGHDVYSLDSRFTFGNLFFLLSSDKTNGRILTWAECEWGIYETLYYYLDCFNKSKK